MAADAPGHREGAEWRSGTRPSCAVYQHAQHGLEQLAGVAKPASESDPARTNVEELHRVYPEWELQVVDDPSKAMLASLSPVQREEMLRPLGPAVAHVLLLLVLVLVLVEVALAWHFAHYSSVAGGFDAPPASGRLLPVLGGAVAFAIMGLIAFVLLHEARTGDFLGFLPDSVRRGVEQAL